MKHSLKQLCGYTILGKDGEIGRVSDFYFDDADWTTRYIVVDTGRQWPGRKVLLSPTAAKRPDRTKFHLPVDLTRAQVVSSPPMESDEPVDRQYEELLSQCYGWPLYWADYPGVPLMAGPVMSSEDERIRQAEDEMRAQGIATKGDPHLRSVQDVTGYHIHAFDDTIGRM